MTLKDWFARYISQIETEMRDCLAVPDPALAGYYGMLLYHLGWADEHFAPAHISSGKRIRPVLCLLACESAQGDVTHAIPPPLPSNSCTTFHSSTTTSKTTAPRGAGVPPCGRCGASTRPLTRATDCSPLRIWQ